MAASKTTGKIERIELYHVACPLPTALFPVWIPGYPQYRQCSTLLAVTTRDGLTGYATGVAFDKEREGLGDFIGRFLVGLDAYNVHAASERLRQSGFLGWRNAWMELAFWDLAAKARQIPLHQLIAEELGEKLSPTIPTSVEPYASFLEQRAPKVRAEAVERAQRIGFKGAKLNVCGATEAEDIEQVRIARDVAGNKFRLMVHARQAWSVSLVENLPAWDVARAVRFSKAAHEYGVQWLQEPLHSESWEELAELSRKSKVPIAGGDITVTIIPLKAVIDRGCYSILTPDVAFAGLANVVRTLKLCKANKLDFSPSSNSDGIGLAANVHALVAWSRIAGQSDCLLEYPWEPPAMIPEHRDALLEEPLYLKGGMLPVPTGPGLGVEIDAKALRRYARKFYTTTPVRFVATARRNGLRQTAELATQKAGKKRTRERART